MRTALSPRGPVREVGVEFFSGNGKNIVHNNINEVSSEQKGIFFTSPSSHWQKSGIYRANRSQGHLRLRHVSFNLYQSEVEMRRNSAEDNLPGAILRVSFVPSTPQGKG